MIDRYHLRYFLAVIDNGNFSRAAAACNVTQPTLSVGIAKLEKSLGRLLFARTNRRVELTDAGTRLASHARMIETGFSAAEREVAGVASARTLRIGVLSSFPRRLLESFLVELRSFAPEHRVEIVEGKDRDIRIRLAQGRIDAAVTILRDGDDRNGGQHLLREGYSLAISTTHPLADEPSIRVEQLANDAMIVRRHCELLADTSRFFTARGVRPFFSSRTTSDDKALGYVRTGLGITVMPDGFVEPGVVRVPLIGFDFTRDIGLVFAPHAGSGDLAGSPVLALLADSIVSTDPR